MKPRHLSALTLSLYPGTELYEDCQAGRFQPVTPMDTLRGGPGSSSKSWRWPPSTSPATTPSNYVPLKGSLPEDRERFLAQLDRALESGAGMRPEWTRGF